MGGKKFVTHRTETDIFCESLDQSTFLTIRVLTIRVQFGSDHGNTQIYKENNLQKGLYLGLERQFCGQKGSFKSMIGNITPND